MRCRSSKSLPRVGLNEAAHRTWREARCVGRWGQAEVKGWGRKRGPPRTGPLLHRMDYVDLLLRRQRCLLRRRAHLMFDVQAQLHRCSSVTTVGNRDTRSFRPMGAWRRRPRIEGVQFPQLGLNDGAQYLTVESSYARDDGALRYGVLGSSETRRSVGLPCQWPHPQLPLQYRMVKMMRDDQSLEGRKRNGEGEPRG
jgi:hypothetical protein